MNQDSSNIILIKDLLIGISAFVGMVLGIYNLIHSIKKEKVKLKIIPKSVMYDTRNTVTSTKGLVLADTDFNSSHSLFAFEIINKSNFPVVIDDIGFKIKGKKSRLSIYSPILGDDGEWPRELMPRKSFVAYAKLDSLIKQFKKNKITSAYVKTSCDSIAYGTSKALKLLKQFIKENA